MRGRLRFRVVQFLSSGVHSWQVVRKRTTFLSCQTTARTSVETTPDRVFQESREVCLLNFKIGGYFAEFGLVVPQAAMEYSRRALNKGIFEK